MITFAHAQKSENTTTPLEFASVIQRLEQAQRNAKPQVSYQVIRQYQLSESNSSHVSSNVVAEVEYSPPDRETYVIQEHSGSSRGEQVVRRILDHESALVAGGPASWSAALLSRDNYAFTNLGESTLNGKSFYLLGLVPKRQEKELIAGRAWVDKNTFLIRRIDGELAKSPSWLLKKVSVRLDFSDVSGIWLQSAMEATADVRFVGSQTLQAQTLDCRKAGVVATRIDTKHARTIHRNVPAELLFPAPK
ncbi:MAG: outer membrane lipoprotein-sorting protein [Acidobacteriia bacterium]|nr:outer membrane lipoprotein-sorting protein [Terriglobia bacterium]